MKRKTSIIVFVVIILGALIFVSTKKPPIVLGSSGSLPKYSIDDKIEKAELILIGEVTTNLPSLWMGSNGSDPKNASPEEVNRARGLFTDSLISIDQIFKGEALTPVIRVRAFTGQTPKVIWSDKSQPSYITGRTFLLFLRKDTGPTENINPGYYKAVGAFQGVYEIVDGRAISQNDEWDLEELIAYIQTKLSELEASPTPIVEVPTETPTEPVPSATASPEVTIQETATPLPEETITPTP
jgi:hypothetical protein